MNKQNYTKVLINSKLVHSTISDEQVKQKSIVWEYWVQQAQVK